jgi:hypothetical protein
MATILGQGDNNGGIVGKINDPDYNAPLPSRISTITSTSTFSPQGNTTAEVLIVGGGAGGPTNGDTFNRHSGGGGAGGVLYASSFTFPGSPISVTIGSGGGAGVKGTDTSFGPAVALGGGKAGGSMFGGAAGLSPGPNDGGSGGGAGSGDPGSFGIQAPSGSFTGYGNNGGAPSSGWPDTSGTGGGGGGANQAGAAATTGTGGNGFPSTITGSPVTYAGGGGASPNRNPGTGGSSSSYGGGGASRAGTGLSGGNGVVIVSEAAIPESFIATGIWDLKTQYTNALNNNWKKG